MPPLPPPARYLPFAHGRYEVSAGLSRLGTDFGNGSADGAMFQIDHNWPLYRKAKLAARARDLERYVRVHELDPEYASLVSGHLIERFQREYPQYFRISRSGEGKTLRCDLSGETLYFNGKNTLTSCDSEVTPRYGSALDALACQVQEDFALLNTVPTDRLCWLHLCFPNHWAATDKIGKDFVAIHAPVPGMDRINKNARQLLRTLSHHGPNVRFAWGLASSDQLDRHPATGGGRSFSADGIVWIRVERQITAPMAGRGFLFTIRTYMLPSAALDQRQLQMLERALTRMPSASKQYKGLAGAEHAIRAALRRHATDAGNNSPRTPR